MSSQRLDTRWSRTSERDGIGDLRDIIARLEYLVALGVDVVCDRPLEAATRVFVSADQGAATLEGRLVERISTVVRRC